MTLDHLCTWRLLSVRISIDVLGHGWPYRSPPWINLCTHEKSNSICSWASWVIDGLLLHHTNSLPAEAWKESSPCSMELVGHRKIDSVHRFGRKDNYSVHTAADCKTPDCNPSADTLSAFIIKQVSWRTGLVQQGQGTQLGQASLQPPRTFTSSDHPAERGFLLLQILEEDTPAIFFILKIFFLSFRTGSRQRAVCFDDLPHCQELPFSLLRAMGARCYFPTLYNHFFKGNSGR